MSEALLFCVFVIPEIPIDLVWIIKVPLKTIDHLLGVYEKAFSKGMVFFAFNISKIACKQVSDYECAI